ncbi:hypothetical protein RPMA_19055 [Tardiphaga alba]|uniref:Helix-turn-helix protein n=1 Tax=Tardiphaga alba TaxID=340268 RepID=A0ABX8AAA1_9BRAD|nr:hypothetical protein [Tardiphaga alba]QUS40696.1 hypothetical protein RPMA_19055 [Tardiphaga alba]
MRKFQSPWTPDEIAKLIELADSGATLIRAAAILNRPQISVRRQAAVLGRFLPSATKALSGADVVSAMQTFGKDD